MSLDPVAPVAPHASATPAAAAAGDQLAVAAPPPTKARDRVSAVLLPVATFAVLLVAWQFLVRLFGVPEYILPVPTEFLAKLVESRALIWQHTLVTAERDRARLPLGGGDLRPARLHHRVVQVRSSDRCTR